MELRCGAIVCFEFHFDFFRDCRSCLYQGVHLAFDFLNWIFWPFPSIWSTLLYSPLSIIIVELTFSPLRIIIFVSSFNLFRTSLPLLLIGVQSFMPIRIASIRVNVFNAISTFMMIPSVGTFLGATAEIKHSSRIYIEYSSSCLLERFITLLFVVPCSHDGHCDDIGLWNFFICLSLVISPRFVDWFVDMMSNLIQSPELSLRVNLRWRWLSSSWKLAISLLVCFILSLSAAVLEFLKIRCVAGVFIWKLIWTKVGRISAFRQRFKKASWQNLSSRFTLNSLTRLVCLYTFFP